MNGSLNLVRLAVLDDAPSILAVFLETEDQTGVKGGVNLLSVIDWIDNASERYPLWVLEKEGRVVAWCALEAFYGLPSLRGVVEVAIYVALAHQQQGIGKQLLRSVQQHCEAHCIHSLVAYILSANDCSQRFFIRNGFVEWGCLPAVARSAGERGDLKLFGRPLSFDG